MRVVCLGWFGNDHGPVTVRDDGGDAAHVSHGMCPECAYIADAAVRDYDAERSSLQTAGSAVSSRECEDTREHAA
jgi:hypothetical protein